VLTKWLRAANAAMGVRKYVILVSATAAPVAYGWLSSNAQRLLGFDLPQSPWFAIALLAGAGLLLFWFLQRLVSLEEELEPRLQIEFKDEHPFSIVDAGVAGPLRRFIRIRVTNKSAQMLRSCIVKLETLHDKDGNPGFYVPIALITQHQLLQEREGGPFALRGGEAKFVEVAAITEPSSDQEITLQYETNTHKPPNGVQYPNTISASNGPYTLRITAYGGGMPTSRSYRLFVNDRDRLRMETIADEKEPSKGLAAA